MNFNIQYGSDVDSGKDVYLNSECNIDFSDICFTNANSDFLDYWIESKIKYY